jgi:hypothetical protein
VSLTVFRTLVFPYLSAFLLWSSRVNTNDSVISFTDFLSYSNMTTHLRISLPSMLCYMWSFVKVSISWTGQIFSDAVKWRLFLVI